MGQGGQRRFEVHLWSPAWAIIQQLLHHRFRNTHLLKILVNNLTAGIMVSPLTSRGEGGGRKLPYINILQKTRYLALICNHNSQQLTQFGKS
jgi:hypothetical protein